MGRNTLLTTSWALIGVAGTQPTTQLVYALSKAFTSRKPPSPSTSRSVSNDHNAFTMDLKDRPLLKKFGEGIRKRIINSEKGRCHDAAGAFTSTEVIPLLNMQSSDATNDRNTASSFASRQDISEALNESHRTNKSEWHGRSSGSGCIIVRLIGDDAASIHGLNRYANRFFDRVDQVEGKEVSDVGVFRIDNHVYAGFDDDVNGEGKMQFMDTRTFCNCDSDDDSNATLLPMELKMLVGTRSMSDARSGMNTLFDIGMQITSAVLGMNSMSAEKLIDDGKSGCRRNSDLRLEDRVSNSYHRLIRYLKPQPSNNDAAFDAHVDSSFLTLIPMPSLPGLEVWCPSRSNCNVGINEEETNACEEGEWVRPLVPFHENENPKSAYVIVLAGEFLQLTSDGKVPVCIHRVIPPKPVSCNSLNDIGKENSLYQPRISSPLFLRPRRGEDVLLNVAKDLMQVLPPKDIHSSTMSDASLSNGLYHENGLLEECHDMHLWSAHDILIQH
eukprot:CCRYP_004079-RA/>CCRYP_004079-RA protein AED:0.00 eAED:0.00 QI:109/-1/1/1/-1/1/1/96/499